MKKNITIILMLIVVISLSIYMIKNNSSNDNKKSNLEMPLVDTFLYDFRDGYDYSSGSAQLYGYVEFENRSDTLSNDMYEYVTFHILESNSEEFMKYLKSNADGVYVKEDAIGLGCLVNNRIKFVNYSDLNTPDNSIIEIDLNVMDILSSTKEKPIKINIGKYINTIEYVFHPVCESMLSSFSVAS
jgi:hypothetical protein